MRYEIPVRWHVPTAKFKGIIPASINVRAIDLYSHPADWSWLVIDVDGSSYSPATDERAYAAVCKRLVTKKDTRPIAGRSYISKWRAPDVATNNGLIPFSKLPRYQVSDRVVLHKAYRSEIDFAGYRAGTVVETVGESIYALRLDGYPHLADFAIREFAPEEQIRS